MIVGVGIMNKSEKKRVLFISSTGGHLDELLKLSPLFNKYDSYLVTEKTKSNKNINRKFKNVSFLIYGTKKHILSYPFKLLLNCFISLFLFIRIRPKFIITTGTHTAGPMCCIGKILGAKIVYIETFANVYSQTVAGKFIYKFADLFVVQWEEMLKFYPKAEYWGWIF